MRIFAIIITYNGSKWIEKCLLSLQKSTVPLRIVVIDNNSSDDTVFIIRNTFPDIELISSKKNLGFGAANNIGFKMALKANADYVFLLNQDARINDKTVELLLNITTKNSEYGILSPFHYNYAGDAPEQYFREWVMDHYTPDIESDFINGCMGDLYPSTFVHAACWLMPISTIKKVGGFDPLFFHYGEDNDYVQRLHFSGIKIGIVANASVYHNAQNPGLSGLGKDIRQKKNELILSLKNLNASMAGAFLLFMKGFMFQLFRSGGYLEVYKSVFKNLVQIFSSRVKQKKQLAYLKS